MKILHGTQEKGRAQVPVSRAGVNGLVSGEDSKEGGDHPFHGSLWCISEGCNGSTEIDLSAMRPSEIVPSSTWSHLQHLVLCILDSVFISLKYLKIFLRSIPVKIIL